MTATALGQLLREYEVEQGLSVKEAAAKVGVKDVRQYQEWRNSGVVPQGPRLKMIGEGLGIPVKELAAAAAEAEHQRTRESATKARRQAETELGEDDPAPPRSD